MSVVGRKPRRCGGQKQLPGRNSFLLTWLDYVTKGRTCSWFQLMLNSDLIPSRTYLLPSFWCLAFLLWPWRAVFWDSLSNILLLSMLGVRKVEVSGIKMQNWAKQLCAASWTRMLLPLSERYLQPLGVEFEFQFQGLAASRTTLVNRVMFCGGYLHVLGLTTCLGNYLPVNRVCCLGDPFLNLHMFTFSQQTWEW